MYIQPNTTVRLLTGVPLDNTYAHTLYFGDVSSQVAYFESKTKAGCLLSNLSYQRYTKGSLRIQKLADDIYDCNYMMFQNTAYGNKWFYAFINNIEYVSNTVCEITYEIDVIQTWFFDVTLLQSFVEREHSATDVVGENIVAEPVPIGEYFKSNTRQTNFYNEWGIIIVSPYRRISVESVNPYWINYSPTLPVPPQTIDKQLNCLYYTVAKTDVDVGQFLYELDEQGFIDSIVNVYPVPLKWVEKYNSGDYITGLTQYDRFVYYSQKPTTLGDYTPKNKKLLTYPYNKFILDTSDGNRREYAFEWFNDSDTESVAFTIYANLLQNMCFRAVPNSYKGKGLDIQESCLLTDFPMTSYINDSYKAWLAQNKTRIAFQLASDVVGVGAGLGNVIAGSQLMTPVTNVLSKPGATMMAQGYDQIGQHGVREIGGIIAEATAHSVNSLHARGSADGCLEIGMNIKDFIGYQEYINPQNARIIDDFFNCYGYATHRVKVPNRNVRPHWTYVKTIDINLESNAPSDDTNKIASIYDKGITFWRKASEVGNYSLDNSPS